MVTQAVVTARKAGAAGTILVRGDSAYGTRSVVTACLRAKVEFSVVMAKNTAVARAIDSIADETWTPVKYPGAVRDPDTGAWISDAEVAETTYTAFASSKNPVTARLIVRRVKDARFPDALFPRLAVSPGFTNTTGLTADADVTHRRHAIIETVFADLIDGPLAHMPSGKFGANSAWVLCAAIAHNLLRATGVLAGDRYSHSRGATLPTQDRQHPSSIVSAATKTDSATTDSLAVVRCVASIVGQHYRTQPAVHRLKPSPEAARHPSIRGKAG